MITMIKTSMVFFMIILIVRAENTVFVDQAFPYRIVCKTEWVQDVKNDSLLLLKNTAPGKMTRLQLQKYVIDTGYDFENKGWSRLRYAINKELVIGYGKLGFVDTSANKKLGNSRAFEIFAFFSEKSGDETIWWAEYTRWTDNNGFGYMASIIGDTVDMRGNYATYKALLDSISISQLNISGIAKWSGFSKPTIQRRPASLSAWHDVLGRNMYGNSRQSNAIRVKKNLKYLLMQ